MKTYKIGKRSNTGTLCVSIAPEMVLEGYAAKVMVEWVKENGAWQLKLRTEAQKQPIEPSSPAAAGTE